MSESIPTSFTDYENTDLNNQDIHHNTGSTDPQINTTRVVEPSAESAPSLASHNDKGIASIDTNTESLPTSLNGKNNNDDSVMDFDLQLFNMLSSESNSASATNTATSPVKQEITELSTVSVPAAITENESHHSSGSSPNTTVTATPVILPQVQAPAPAISRPVTSHAKSRKYSVSAPPKTAKKETVKQTKQSNSTASVNAINFVRMGGTSNDEDDDDDGPRISAYARLDFPHFTFYVQTLQVLLGRKVDDGNDTSVDVHLGSTKAISRKHGKIFYNFGNQRFELSILGRNGAFVDETFVESGVTLPLKNNTKIQIGEIPFQFVLPTPGSSIKKNSQRKQINPADAINLKSSLYNSSPRVSKQAQNNTTTTAVKVEDGKQPGLAAAAAAAPPASASAASAAALPSVQTAAASSASVAAPAPAPASSSAQTSAPSSASAAALAAAKEKPAKKVKQPKKVYTLEEIPEQYRTKPSHSYSHLIAMCLKDRSTESGLSLSEIYKGIQDLFPYYFYCPDGWQSSVRHNLSLNKSFKKVKKEGKGWLWGLDEEYYNEKEKANSGSPGSNNNSTGGYTTTNTNANDATMLAGHKSNTGSVASMAGKTSSSSPTPASLAKSNSPPTGTPSKPASVPSHGSANNIQAQLAANRSNIASAKSYSPPPSTTSQKEQGASENATNNSKLTAASEGSSSSSSMSKLSGDTMKALNYLQQELIRLTKDRKGLDKQTTTQILTQALAMTISQVNQAAKNSGMTGNPLVLLIDKNPQHLTKILTAALNAATYQVTKGKVKPGMVNNNVSSSTSSSNVKATVKQPAQAQAQKPATTPVATSKPSTASSHPAQPQNHTKPPMNDRFRPPHVTNPAPQQLTRPPVAPRASPPIQRAAPVVAKPTPVVKQAPVVPAVAAAASAPVAAPTKTASPAQQSPTTSTTPKPAAFSRPAAYSPRPTPPATSANAAQTAAQSNVAVPEKSKIPKPASYSAPAAKAPAAAAVPATTTAERNVPKSTSPLVKPSSASVDNPKDNGSLGGVTINSAMSNFNASGSPSGSVSVEVKQNTVDEDAKQRYMDADALHDPEFDKVLESFSRQATPGLDDNDDNDEPVDLEKLLAEDGYLNDPIVAQAGVKRPSEAQEREAESFKVAKTE